MSLDFSSLSLFLLLVFGKSMEMLAASFLVNLEAGR